MPGQVWNPGCGERQVAVTGNALDHRAIRAGPQLSWICSVQPRRLESGRSSSAPTGCHCINWLQPCLKNKMELNYWSNSVRQPFQREHFHCSIIEHALTDQLILGYLTCTFTLFIKIVLVVLAHKGSSWPDYFLLYFAFIILVRQNLVWYEEDMIQVL